MKQLRRCQRILFLSLLSLSVLAPIILVATRLKSVSSSIGRKEFLEDLSAIKYRSDTLKLSAIEQETVGDFKEPKSVVYEDNSLVSYSSSNKNDTDKGEDHGEAGSGTDRKSIWIDRHTKILSSSDEKVKTDLQGRSNLGVMSTKTTVRHDHNVWANSRRVTDEKVKEIKDQLIRAQIFLNLAPPNSRSHWVKELRLRIKELKRAIGEAVKDSDLSRSALQRSKLMEVSLSKASRVYPDCTVMANKLRAMTDNSEEQVKAQNNQVSYLVHLVAKTTPKGLHCLTMRLTAEYFALRSEERHFLNGQKLSDPNLYHYAVFSDNVLAVAVVVNSTVSASKEPEKIVFHVVTDSLNLAAISMWFLLNAPGKAAIEVQSIDNFEWLPKNNITLKKDDSHDPRYISALNHLRFYLPDVFPALHKIVLFDHDVVVQKDLAALWRTRMKGKVIAAVETCREGEYSFRKMDKFINFSNPFLAERFDAKACTWAFGMNLFNLREWRRQKLTALYHRYMHLGEKHPLWKAGSLPLGWITFYKRTVALDRRWHVLGLGYESGVGRNEIERGAVIHYDGVMKPWLEIGIGKYKGYWSKYLNYEIPSLQQCNIHQ